ncbi:hypothetical protein SSX86_005507 [Deinandra increscens subsp. villosa]|uniref:non-specific serine/threonine protein kinase n=1 Tax=Deinandra increscens subsp. villosa TaxID=3103831 RepID=A0AAP0DLB8_9ASTR
MSILTCFFLALIPTYGASISFSFTNITPKDSHNIILSGDADYNPEEGIRVTHERNREVYGSLWLAGRATYIKPLHLWDKDSNLASFSTSFTFVIDSNRSSFYGDGLTFFLAQNNSVINAGGYMGLPFDSTIKTTRHRFVAVEFDTFGNEWDPKDPLTNISIDDHVGININSITSVAYRKWFTNITYGKDCRAMINYDSDSKNLNVSFTNLENDSIVWENGLEYIIDLRRVLPEWVIFGFSASTGNQIEKHNVISWTFNSTEFKVDENKGKNNRWRRMGLIVGMLVVVTGVGIIVCFLYKKKKVNGDQEEELELLKMNNEFEMGASMPRRFSYHELARSTADFAETEKLGEGGFGGVYKGFLKDLSMYVAVKRVSKTSKQGIKEYASEVCIISRLRHRNLVQLTGWCHEKGELLLVYEFMENGSLDLHLFKGRSLLKWNTRYKIAHGLASALLYLHEEWEQCVLHRDIKSSNVMLDSNFNAKLGDFGLAKLVDHEKGSQTTLLAGTFGYMAPECVVTGKATKESDVFSFGVVALEIACGRKAVYRVAHEEHIRLLEWVWELYGNDSLLEAVDPSLGLEFEEEEVKRLMMIGLWCVHPDSKFRPSMREVIKVLSSGASLPLLPSKMPVASYWTPPVPSSSSLSSSYQSSCKSIEPHDTELSEQLTSSSRSIIVCHSMKQKV